MASRDPFVSEEEQRLVVAQAEAERRAELYIEDLTEILSSATGRRVLRHWLDMANVFGAVSVGGEGTIKAAALSDYGKNRLCEIAAASPENYLRIMLAGMQNKSSTENKE